MKAPDDREMGMEPKKAATAMDELEQAIHTLGSVAIGFSGGVDSSLVVAVSARILGRENVLAVTSRSETLPSHELAAACDLAVGLGVRHEIIHTRELDCDDFRANPPDRCYHCKAELWSRAGELARRTGLRHLADGTNADDAGDTRPGTRAGDEAGVRHPLAEAGAGKDMVRRLAREMGLPNWDKPAQACLSSRFPYGMEITREGLRRVEEAERFLRELGLEEFRVRDHGDLARIEVREDSIAALAAKGRRRITERFRELGYVYVALDLQGFRSGSMNEVL